MEVVDLKLVAIRRFRNRGIREKKQGTAGEDEEESTASGDDEMREKLFFVYIFSANLNEQPFSNLIGVLFQLH